MRPRSIIWFERAAIAYLAFFVLNSYLLLSRPVFATPEMRWRRDFDLIAYTLIFVATLFLQWLAARRANAVAKWLYTALGGLRISSTVAIPLVGGSFRAALTPLALIQLLLLSLSLWLLFRRDSRDWFAGRRPVDPAVFD